MVLQGKKHIILADDENEGFLTLENFKKERYRLFPFASTPGKWLSRPWPARDFYVLESDAEEQSGRSPETIASDFLFYGIGETRYVIVSERNVIFGMTATPTLSLVCQEILVPTRGAEYFEKAAV